MTLERERHPANSGSRTTESRLTVRRETASGDIGGYLAPCLEKVYLQDYLGSLQQLFPEKTHLAQIPTVAENILTQLVNTKGVKQAFVFGGVARFIAHGMNPQYASIMADFQAERAEELGKSDTPDIVRQFFNNPESFSSDPDLDVMFDGVPMLTLAQTLINNNSVSVDAIQHEAKMIRFELRHDDQFTIKVTAGPVLTAPGIEIMKVELFDTASERRIFHMDICKTVATPQMAGKEKRLGMTFKKQDYPLAYLSVNKRNKHLHFFMEKDTAHVMFERDSIDTETADPGTLLELGLRSMRMSLMHENDQFVTINGKTIYLPQLFAISPQYDESIFRFRELIRRASQIPSQIPEEVMVLAKKELALCLKIDPWVTTQFLRDTGITILIPGLRHLTRAQLNKLLLSNEFDTNLEDGLHPPKLSERTEAYLLNQRHYYKTEGLRDGMKRFMRALDSTNAGHEWEAFLRLFEYPQKRTIALAKIQESLPLYPSGRIIADVNGIQVVEAEGNRDTLITSQYVITFLKIALENLEARDKTLPERLSEAERQILAQAFRNSRLKNTAPFNRLVPMMDLIEALYKRKLRVTGGVGAIDFESLAEFVMTTDETTYAHMLQQYMDEAAIKEFVESLTIDYSEWNIWRNNLAYVLVLLQELPGLSAKELAPLYEVDFLPTFESVQKMPFPDILLDLKFLGFLAREESIAYDLPHGAKERRDKPITFYSPLGVRTLRSIEDIRPEDLLPFYRDWLMSIGQPSSKSDYIDKTTIQKLINRLTRSNIITVEALTSLTVDEDAKLIKEKYTGKQTVGVTYLRKAILTMRETVRRYIEQTI